MLTESDQNFLNFSKPVVESCITIFEQLLAIDVKSGKPTIDKDQKSQGDISSILNISGNLTSDNFNGDFNVTMVISISEPVFLKVASNMFEMDFTEIDEEIQEVAGEVSNMILGNAKIKLKDAGYNLDMALPEVNTGKGTELDFITNTVVISVPLECEFGLSYVELCYKQNS